MKLSSKHGHTALLFAVAGAAVLGAGAKSSFATPFTTTTQTDTLVETPSNFSGATRLTAEGTTSGAAPSFFDYSLLQFSTSALLPTQTQATAFNSLSLNLVDKAESFAISGLVDVYLVTLPSVDPNTLSYQSNATFQPQGIGAPLLGNLTSLGQINYQTHLANATTGATSTAGTAYTTSATSLTLSPAVQSYILNQINNGGLVSLVLADDSSGVAADFEGSAGTTTLAKPSLALDVNTGPITAANSTFTINGGTNAQTIDLGRVVQGTAGNATVTITNSGTNSGIYTLLGSTAGAAGTLTAAGIGTVGVLPVPALGGTSNITVGMNSTNVTPGTATAATPATATVTIHDQTNASDPDSIVTIKADQVVTARLIDNSGGENNIVQYGKVLAGTTSAPQAVTLDTENTNTIADQTSNSLTSVTLLGNTTVTAVLADISNTTLDNDEATLAADPNNNSTLFNDGSVVATRNVSFIGGTAAGGLWQTNSFFDGFLTIPLQNSDTALGASTTPTARVYVEADVYQQASVSVTSSGTNDSLTNALHTFNNITLVSGGPKTDIGARSSAQITAIGTLVAQAGYSLDPALTVNAVIADGASLVATDFASAGKWNGTYVGTLPVTLQNDQTISGAKPNDLGTVNFALSTVVTGNTGNASVNILKNGSFAGYSIPRGAGKNSTVSLLGGTSTNGNTISVVWSDASSARAASDKATLSENGSDTFVVEMSYDPSVTGDSLELASTNGSGVNVLAVDGNSDGGASASETVGAYTGTTTLGAYGIDPVAHTVWAVVNHVGAFEAFSRMTGDANGDGKVDLNDLNVILNNLGTTTALWSHGNFDSAATIDLTDLNDVLNNLGTGLPTGAVAQSVVATPEPTTLGIAGLGVAGMLLRRRRAAR